MSKPKKSTTKTTKRTAAPKKKAKRKVPVFTKAAFDAEVDGQSTRGGCATCLVLHKKLSAAETKVRALEEKIQKHMQTSKPEETP